MTKLSDSVSSTIPFSLFAFVLSASACENLATPEYTGDALVEIRGTVVHGENPDEQEVDTVPGETQISLLWLKCEEGIPCGPAAAFYGHGGGPGGDATCFIDCEDRLSEACHQTFDPESEECRKFESCFKDCSPDAKVEFDLEIVMEGFIVEGTSQSLAEVEGEFPAKFNLAIKDAPGPENYLRLTPDEPRVAAALLLATGPEPVTVDYVNAVVGDFRGIAQDHILLHAKDPIPPKSYWGLVMGLQDELEAGYHIIEIAYETTCIEFEGEYDPEDPYGDSGTSVYYEVQSVVGLPLASQNLKHDIPLTLASLDSILATTKFPLFEFYNPDLLMESTECADVEKADREELGEENWDE